MTLPPSSIATRAAEIARRFEERIETVNLPVTRASSILFDTLADAAAAGAAATTGERHKTSYGTVGTPTTFALTDAIAELEGAPHACRAALMPSGLSAITTALLARFGVTTEFYDPAIGAGIAALMRPSTRIVYMESPGSYTLEVQDVPAICSVARSRGALTILDNTWASPALARPFDWGVDVSVIALTKYWSGHADLLMGAVVVREDLWPALWVAIRQLGVCVGADDAWLVLRSMRTLDLRMRAHGHTALQVARWLQTRPEVARVLHPALPEHPGHQIFMRDFLGASGLFSFELKAATPAQLAALCERRRHFRIGYSWGGYESLIVVAKLDTIRSVGPWRGGPLLRIHCGLECPDDLIADLQQGFDAMALAAS